MGGSGSRMVLMKMKKNEKGESAVSKWSLVTSPLRTGGTDQLVNTQKNGCKDA